MLKKEIEVSIIKDLVELEKAYDVRRQVFMIEGDEPESEQFDGNDLCATHLIAYWNGIVAGTMRLRVISGADGGTIIWERLSVIKEVREQNPWVFRALLNSARLYTEMMGLKTVLGIVENPKLMRLWFFYGFHKTGEKPLLYRGHKYTPICMTLKPEIEVETPSLRHAVLAVPEIFAESRLRS